MRSRSADTCLADIPSMIDVWTKYGKSRYYGNGGGSPDSLTAH